MHKLHGLESGDIIKTDFKKKLIYLIDGIKEEKVDYYIMENSIIIICNNERLPINIFTKKDYEDDEL